MQQLLAIRKRCRDLIFPAQIDGPAPAIFPVAATGSLPLPVPYLYAAADRALLVLGNPDRGQSAQVRVDLMQTLPGWDPAQSVRVVDLWAGSPVWETSSADLARHVFTVPPDGIPRGGLAVVELHRLPG